MSYVMANLPRMRAVGSAAALVVPVDARCLADTGLASIVSKVFPDNFEVVKLLCQFDEISPGEIYTGFTGKLINPRYLMFFVVGGSQGGTLATVSTCLERSIIAARRLDIVSVTLPSQDFVRYGLDRSLVSSLANRVYSKEKTIEIVCDQEFDPDCSKDEPSFIPVMEGGVAQRHFA